MKQPLFFIGHGSPMNAICENEITKKWKEMLKNVNEKAILMISAHYYGRENAVQNDAKPSMIYDMYGFPQELYEIEYKAPGSAWLTARVKELLPEILLENEAGFDHGAWSVLIHTHKEAKIPVVQLKVNLKLSPKEQFELSRNLAILRDEGVLIMASGNIVHNLRLANREMNGGYEEVKEFDEYIKQNILENNTENLLNLHTHKYYKLSVPTPEHLAPLYYILGLKKADEKVTCFNQIYQMGTLSMTSYKIG